MAWTDGKKYLVDGQPMSPRELIDDAAAVDATFARDWLKETSVAANILRDLGHTVERNPDWQEEQDASL